MHSLLLHQLPHNIKKLHDSQLELIHQNVQDSQFVIMLLSIIQMPIINGINLPNTGINQLNNGTNPLLIIGINLLNTGINQLHNGINITNGIMLHMLLPQLTTIYLVPVVTSKLFSPNHNNHILHKLSAT